MITRLLVANRGEIARRVFRTCRELGVETVAVFSDADAGAPHVAEADHAVRLRGVRPAETYLDVERVLAACRTAGADAVHPGYGFLSENAGFARAVLEAGLVWVGPPPEAIAAMGSKVAAKRLMAEAGVPVLPSLEPDAALPADWRYPVLVKASAGGGGRGMRVVRSAADLAREVASARREAEAAFGDGTVFVEPLLDRARHVEVQLLADGHGTVWALGERECSVQRRHQKVVEECPSPGMGEETRSLLREAAVRAARTIGYVGAGTVEFLVRGDQVAFLEMNTRLQVEHPVTELVHGVDLVRLQLAVAEGAALDGEPPGPRGHAVEARLYAEDRDYLPRTGVLWRFEIPGDVRVDSGVESGSEVSPHYDAMLAKVVAHGASRAEAVRKLTTALRRARLHGVTTNRDLLLDILTSPAFLAGDTHVGFLDDHRAALSPGARLGPAPNPEAPDTAHGTGPTGGTDPTAHGTDRTGGTDPTAHRTNPTGGTDRTGGTDPTAHGTNPAGGTDEAVDGADQAGGDDGAARAVALPVLAAALAMAAARRRAAPVLGSLPSGWRNVRSQPQRARFAEAEVVYQPLPAGVTVVAAAPDRVVLERDGLRHTFDVALYGAHDAAHDAAGERAGEGAHDGARGGDPAHVAKVYVDSPGGRAELTPLPVLPEPVATVVPGSLLAPMPGSVLRVEVRQGERVAKGQPVLVLEAMKMEHRIAAPAAGVVSGVHVEEGQQVRAGAVLAVIEETAGRNTQEEHP